jgi:hypothetical protein
MQEPRYERLEGLFAHSLASGGHRAHRKTVITPVAGNDLVAILPGVRTAGALPGDFQSGFDSLRSAIDEKHSIQAFGQQTGKPASQPRSRRVRLSQGIIRQLPHLLVNSVGNLMPAVAGVDAPQTGHGIEIAAAVRIPDPAAFATDDFQRRMAAKIVVLQIAVPEVIDVEIARRLSLDCIRHKMPRGSSLLYVFPPEIT